MADAPGYFALAVALITGGTQVLTTRISTGTRNAIEEAKKNLDAGVEAAKKEAAEAKAAVSELRSYVSTTVAPVLTELHGLRADVKELKRVARQATQPSLPNASDFAKMAGVDELVRRVEVVEQEQQANRQAEAGRQREMGKVMAMLEMVLDRQHGGRR